MFVQAADSRPVWEQERAHVENTLQRQRKEMLMDKQWLEHEEKQLVRDHISQLNHVKSACFYMCVHVGCSTYKQPINNLTEMNVVTVVCIDKFAYVFV